MLEKIQYVRETMTRRTTRKNYNASANSATPLLSTQYN